MARLTLRMGLAGLALGGALLATAVPAVPAAHAQSSPPPPRVISSGTVPWPADKPGLNCRVTRVQLNEANPAVATCLDTTPPSTATPGSAVRPLSARYVGTGVGFLSSSPSSPLVRPRISQRDPCASTDLHLWADASGGGNVICFYNTGTANLTDYYAGWFGSEGSWNDTASSFDTGNWNGKFYWDTNSGPPSYSFTAHPGTITNFDSYWNDQVSSLCIGPSPSNCVN